MERLLVIFQWKSLDQPNIYLTEEHESLRRVVLRMTLVQGVLEIPCLVKVYMPRTVKSKHHLDVREND